MMKKILAVLLIAAAMLSLAACGSAPKPTVEVPEVVPVVKDPTEEQYAAWAVANGYVLEPEKNGYAKVPPELATSATESAGGINYGVIDWSSELQAAAIREWLKGGMMIADAEQAQDDTGYNYRNMMQLATCYNNVPNNSNVELVLDADSLHLLGVSEAGTAKVLEFTGNPEVCAAWSRQLSPAEAAAGYTYFSSYGLSYYGTVKVYSADDLADEEGQDALLNLFDRYYITDPSFWMGYVRDIEDWSDGTAVREAKLAYIDSTLAAGSLVAFEIIPTRVVITAPFVLLLVPQYNNALAYTAVQEDKEDKYAYELGISDEFIDLLIAVKNEFLSDANGAKAAEEYYGEGMFTMLDPICEQMGLPSHLEMVMDPDNAAGMRTQTVWFPD